MKTVLVEAIEHKGQIYILQNGRLKSGIESLSKSRFRRAQWMRRAKFLAQKAIASAKQQHPNAGADPWVYKCNTLAIAGRRADYIRNAYIPGKAKGVALTEYATKEWGAADSGAVKRMLNQAENRFKRSNQDAWVKWSGNKSSGQAKRLRSMASQRKAGRQGDWQEDS